MRSFALTGLAAAPYTAFRPDGRLNLDAIPAQVDLLEAGGVRSVFICGTTGEGASLTTDERIQLAQAWRRATAGRLQLVIHVGHNSHAESCRLGEHAAAIGADAIASIAPNFYKPIATADLVDWCACVADSAPVVPFYYYHMPALTGIRIRGLEFLERAAARIPTLRGIKFTDEDLMDFAACVQFHGRAFDIVFGRDEILLAALGLGAARL
jgi:N-acetylneuraminate lyase